VQLSTTVTQKKKSSQKKSRYKSALEHPRSRRREKVCIRVFYSLLVAT